MEVCVRFIILYQSSNSEVVGFNFLFVFIVFQNISIQYLSSFMCAVSACVCCELVHA